MGISSSMNAGVAGLNANANKLGTIADNIANSQTNGYKRADVDFASMTVNDARTSYAIGGGRSYTAGGVTTTAIFNIEAKGAVTGTDNATDIAISGRGMLPVTSIASVGGNASDQDLMLTSTGSFDINAKGYLTTSSGLVLLGWAANANGTIPAQPRDSASGLQPVRVNLSGTAALPSSEIVVNANLPATATAAGSTGDAQPINVEYFDNLGAAQTLSMTFTPTVPAAGNPNSNTWTLDIVDQATGLSAGSYQIVFSTASGNAGNIASVTQLVAGATPPSTTYDATTGEMSLQLGDQAIAIQLGSTDAAGAHHLTQLSSTFSSSGVTKDGNAAGTFTGLSIDEKGLLSASYSTGFSRVIYQIPVADVPNLNGLRVLDNQSYAVSSESGPLFLYDAGTGPVGGIEGFALEQSTTDTANELTQLIQTQRAYSSNAKIIQTVDEMMQETTNLKR
ncbi:flagellar hook protein FlgE [uncultured Amaricoccus sp.]|uniref:flagellar hook protein FlgE n=1 Tax=uncultured Amaricoccus sp. TaxID=339341 RepID=UPI002637B6B7|nr:flagellar hook-basal body complex protein [uncultured Amaricoccus sp.]